MKLSVNSVNINNKKISNDEFNIRSFDLNHLLIKSENNAIDLHEIININEYGDDKTIIVDEYINKIKIKEDEINITSITINKEYDGEYNFLIILNTEFIFIHII